MLSWLRYILLVLTVLSYHLGQAQLNSNLHRRKIATKGEITLDRNSIVPHTFYIPGIDSSYYHLDEVNSMLQWRRNIVLDSVDVVYRTFPMRWNAVTQRFSYDSIVNISISSSRATGNKSLAAGSDGGLFNFGKIDYNGSFGRSMSFGNSQDAVFNSQFNLQMSGYIGDSIQISAAISDNNIPIQPDGTTQRLNEFDQILLEFKKKNWQVDLGDVDLRQSNNYYLSFYKRLQGLAYQQQWNIGKNVVNRTTLSGAVAKGKFARNVLTVTEGNQGPYLLSGNNGETNFMVLAGTEKVFMDGVQLQRGEDQDYIIDYNTAQLTFTQKNLISKDRRIQVEFEYSDRNYLNYMLYASNETDFGKKLKLRVAAYSNADAKNSPINQTLDDAQKQFLANLGDSTDRAFYPVAQRDSFDAAKIMYRRMDSLVNGVHYTVYQYSTNPDSAQYNLTFAGVGDGRGDYILTSGSANGRVYQWVAPVGGVHQGSYEPAQFLVAPKQQRVLTVGTDYRFNDRNQLSVQLAASKYDVNTFSHIDKGNDNGQAGKLVYTHLSNWKSEKKKYQLKADAGYEWNTANFQTVERLRPVEFARDWGLNIIPLTSSEKLPSLNVVLQDDASNTWSYSFGSYLRGDGFSAYRNVARQQQHTASGWDFDNQLSLTNAQNNDIKISYWRPTLNVGKSFRQLGNYSIGAGYLQERNLQRFKSNDSLDYNSFGFETLSAFLRSDASKPNNWGLTYYTRRDDMPYNTILQKVSRSNNINLSGQWTSNRQHQIRFNATYRSLQVYDSLRSGSQPEKTALGRVEYLVHEWKGFLTGNALYEVGSGQEQKREYTYVEVTAGQGQYTWNDYNGDGIAQLNEFELAAFKDQAKYIRLYTSTNQYIKANYTQFNYSFMLNPRVFATSDSVRGWKRFWAKWNLQSSLQTNKKELARGVLQFNPFQGSIADTSIINLSYIWSNTLSFNRSGSVWGIDLTNLLNYNKALLTYGTEGHQQNNWIAKGRVNIARYYTVELRQQWGRDNLETPSFDNRNYHLRIAVTEPTVSYTAGTKFRILGGYQYGNKYNSPDNGGEKAISNILRVESKFNAVNSTVIGGKFLMNKISYTGDVNSTVGYILLDGLLPGQNYQWSVNLTKRLLKNLELSFQYDGRKPASSRIVHLGTASVRAVL